MPEWMPFGAEQASTQESTVRRWAFRLFGDLRFGLRLRGWYLARALRDMRGVRRILETGCSHGQMSFWLSRRFPDAVIRCVDIDPRLVAYCTDLAARQGVRNLEFIVADLSDYADPDTYDLVICFDVLEHIVDWQAAVRRMAALLRPGGRLLIHTPRRGRFQDPQFGLRRWFGPRGAAALSVEHVREGFAPEDFAFLRSVNMRYRAGLTFAPLAMWAHTAFEIYRERSWIWHLLLSPLLLALAKIEARRPAREGGGIFVRAVKGPLRP